MGRSVHLGYYAYYDHREREGFREANSDYDLNNGSVKLVYDVNSDSRFVLTLDGLRRRTRRTGWTQAA